MTVDKSHENVFFREKIKFKITNVEFKSYMIALDEGRKFGNINV